MAQETEGVALIPDVIRQGVRALVEDPARGFYLVAESGGQVVGSLMITTEWSDWRNGLFWWIQSVYVLPNFRRQGIYRKLYEHVKELADMESHVCGFRLYVENENITAQEVYNSLGMGEAPYRIYEELKPGWKFFSE